MKTWKENTQIKTDLKGVSTNSQGEELFWILIQTGKL